MRKRFAALVLAASTILVLIPGVANASSDARTCIRIHRGPLNIQIGYCR